MADKLAVGGAQPPAPKSPRSKAKGLSLGIKPLTEDFSSNPIAADGAAPFDDPRSPSTRVPRTPVNGLDVPADFDPRSPTVEVQRTPLDGVDPKAPAATFAFDPRSPAVSRPDGPDKPEKPF